jgi:hypothetical protein
LPCGRQRQVLDLLQVVVRILRTNGLVHQATGKA